MSEIEGDFTNRLTIEVGGLRQKYPAATQAVFYIVASDEDEFLLDSGYINVEDFDNNIVASATHLQDSPNSCITDPIALNVPSTLGEQLYLIKCWANFSANDLGAEDDAATNTNAGTNATTDAKAPTAQLVAQAYIAFEVTTHQIGMTVWGPVSPVVAEENFELNVGVQCDGKCDWQGAQGTVSEGERTMGRFTLSLSDEAKEGERFFTSKLSLPAPSELGMHTLSVTLDGQSTAVPHNYVSRNFALVTCGAPSAKLSLRLLDSRNDTPKIGAWITIKASDGVTYKAKSDDDGRAEIALPAGKTILKIRKQDFVFDDTEFELEGKQSMTITLKYFPAPSG